MWCFCYSYVFWYNVILDSSVKTVIACTSMFHIDTDSSSENSFELKLNILIVIEKVTNHSLFIRYNLHSHQGHMIAIGLDRWGILVPLDCWKDSFKRITVNRYAWFVFNYFSLDFKSYRKESHFKKCALPWWLKNALVIILICFFFTYEFISCIVWFRKSW